MLKRKEDQVGHIIRHKGILITVLEGTGKEKEKRKDETKADRLC